MEKIVSLFRKRQGETDETALNNQYFTWNSPFESEEGRYAVWHTEYGFDHERNLQENEFSVNIVDELSEPNGGDVAVSQPSATTQPTCEENGEVITTETFTYNQFGTDGTEDEGDTIDVNTCTRILLIVGLVICKPFGQIMFDNYFLSRHLEYHGEGEEAARRFRLALIWGFITYMSFVLYMTIIGVIIFL